MSAEFPTTPTMSALPGVGDRGRPVSSQASTFAGEDVSNQDASNLASKPLPNIVGLEGVSYSRRQRQGSSPSRQSSVNLNMSADHAALSVAHPMAQYHEKSMENVMICLIITSIVVGVFSYLQLNVGWSVGALGIAMFSIRRRNTGIKDDFLAHVTRKRLEALQNPEASGESAEWINAILKTIWPILNPDLFSSLMSLLEDTMKKHSPGIIRGIRLQDLVLGSNNLQVLSFKVLPNTVNIGGIGGKADEGDFISLEVEFAYRRLPPPHPKSGNTHFMAYFKVGPKGASIEVPVIVEIRGVTGRLQLRIQLISDPPFVRHVFVCFPSTPELHVVANPLRSTIDLMNVPILSQFVDNALIDVLKLFTAPEFYAIDCSRVLVGSDVDVSPHSTGIIVVIVHYATDLSRQDAAYVSVGFARFGKPLYSTRTIKKEEHGEPHFEEAFFLRVIPDDADEHDSIRLTLWDSLGSGDIADDMIGTVDVPLDDLFHAPHTMSRHEQPFQQINRRPRPRGKLSFSIGFFALARRDLDKAIKAASEAGDLPSFLNNRHGTASRASLYSERIKGALDSLIPPDPELPSGILSIQLHSLDNVEIPEIRGVVSSRKRDRIPPSTYCQLFVNDEKLLQSRVKAISSHPYINASSEIFCRDWTTTSVTVIVMESREKEEDTVIGLVFSTLANLLHGRTQKTTWHSLIGGNGYGRLRMSVLFKSLAIVIPKPLRTWNVGVLVISRVQAHGIPADFLGQVEVSIGAVASKTPFVRATSTTDQKKGIHTSCCWTIDPFFHMPVVNRHQSAIVLKVQTRDGLYGQAVVWLSSINDNEITTIHQVPIYSSEFERFQQNNWSAPSISKPHTKKDKRKSKTLESVSSIAQDLPPSVGTLEVELHFEPGLSYLHRASNGPVGTDVEDSLRAWECRVKALESEPGADEIPLPKSRDSRSPNTSQPTSRRSSFNDGSPPLQSSEERLPSSDPASTRTSTDKRKTNKPLNWVKGLSKLTTKSGKDSSLDTKLASMAPDRDATVPSVTFAPKW